MTKITFSFFSLKNKKIFTIITLTILIISLFSIFLPNIKADVITSTTTNVKLTGVNTNVGQTVSLNGYDVFVTDNFVLIYDGNGSVLVKQITLSLGTIGTYCLNSRIVSLNATTFLVISCGGYNTNPSGGGGTNNAFSFVGFIFNTDTSQNNTFTIDNVDSTTNGFGSFAMNTIDMIVTQSQSTNIYYVLASGYVGNDNQYNFYQTTLLKINLNPNSFTHISDYNSINTFLGGASFWFTSQTSLNTMYIITANSTLNTGYVVYKLNPVTPSLTELFSYADSYNNLDVYYIDYGYNTINASTNAFYDVLFAHPITGTTNVKQFNVDLLRFNDTNFFADYQYGFTDSNIFGNIPRIISSTIPNGVWGNSLYPTLYGSTNNYSLNFGILYAGQLGYIYGINFYIWNLNNIVPTFNFASTGAYKFNNGNNNILVFASSNNVGGLLSPYGYGNEFQIDFQNNQVCSDFQISLQPSTGLYLQWNIIPVYSQKNVILPYTYGAFSLSQNSSYIITSSILYNGVVQTNGTYSVFDDGLSSVSPFGRDFSNSLVTNAQINTNGAIIINVPFDNTMTNTPYYNAYQVNVTINSYTYVFLLSFSWYFTDINGVPLPKTYIGEQGGGNINNGGNGNNNSGGTDSIIPIITQIFGNVKTDIIFLIFGVICALLTWKFALTGLIAGIGISTFLCTMAGLLAIWAVGLCIILDITLIVLGSGLLNKTENKGDN